jgi:4-amino-4-deoxy-L-arabinose transferase-like glycosyltransferase
MRSDRYLPWIAFALAAALLLIRLGGLPLIDPDEGRNARVAWEMKESGAWFAPTYDGLPYLDKPAAFFKAVALSFSLLGRSEGAARLPSALSGLVLLGLVFAFCRRAYDRRTAALAVLIIASTPLFIAFARTVIFDMPLALVVSLSILAVYRAEESRGRPRALWYLVGAAAAGAGTLIKGPVGFVIPGLINLVVHVLKERDGAADPQPKRSWWGRRNWRFLARAFAPLNLLVFFGLTLPWFLGLLRARPDFAQYGLVEETFRRYSTTAFHRTAPAYYYVPVVLGTFFPWSLILPEAMRASWRRRRAIAPADRLCLIWAVVVVLFFSTSQSKLPGYILSAAVPSGILTARLFAGAWRDATSWAARLVRRATGLLAAVCLLLGAVASINAGKPATLQRLFHIHSSEFDRMQPVFAPLMVTLFALAAAAGLVAVLRWTSGGVTRGAKSSSLHSIFSLAVFLLFPVSLLTICFGGLRGYAEAGSSRGLVRSMGPLPAGCTVACLECFPTGLPFYLERSVTLISRDGHELTSNYLLFLLRRAERWPEPLVPRHDLGLWRDRQTGPLYLLARNKGRSTLDSLARRDGVQVRGLRPGWWGVALPARGTR